MGWAELNVDQKLSRGRHLAGQKAPYLQQMLLSYAPQKSADIDSFASTKDMILLYNEDTIREWSVDWITFAWWHECWHFLLKHFSRCGDRDPVLYNLAGDLFINDQAREAGFFGKSKYEWEQKTPPFIALPEKFSLPGNLSTDEYYEKLLQQASKTARKLSKALSELQEAPGAPSLAESGSQASSGGSKEKGQGKPGESQEKGGPGESFNGQFGAGQCGSCAGNAVKNEPIGPEQGGRSEVEITNNIRQTAEAIQQEASKGRGRLPAGILRWASLALEPPKVRWQTLFSKTVRRAVAYKAGAVDWKYSRSSRRQAALGYGGAILPGLIAPVPEVAFVLDTSGSMGPKEIKAALTEANGVLKALNADVTFCACDAAVHELKKVRNMHELKKLVKGGGGTDFRPAFEQIMKQKTKPNVIVFATDGYGTAPEHKPSGVDVVWLLINSTYHPCEWGTFIEVES